MRKKVPNLSKNVKTLIKEGDKLLNLQDLGMDEIQSFLDRRDVLLSAFQELQEDEDTHEFKEQLRQLFLQGEAMLVRLLKMSDDLAQSISDVSRQRQAIQKYKFPIVDTEQYTLSYDNQESRTNKKNKGNSSPDVNKQQSSSAKYTDEYSSDGETHHTDRHC